jgi:hypothetical protein
VWTPQEKIDFRRLLEIHGKNWAVIAEQIPTKTPMQVRNYFQNHSADQELRQIAARAEKPPRGAGNVNKVSPSTSFLLGNIAQIVDFQLLKPISNAPGVSSPLTRVFALGDLSPANPTWTGQLVPSHSQPSDSTPIPAPVPLPTPQQSLPGFRDLMREQMLTETWRHQQIPSSVPRPNEVIAISSPAPQL